MPAQTMRIVKALAALLAARGAGTLGVSVFAVPATMPTGAAGFLTIEETGGAAALGTHEDPMAIRRPAFQIVARKGTDYSAARDLADLAFDAFSKNTSNLTAGDVFFLSIRPIQDIFSLGLDPAGRPRAAFNIETKCRLLPS